MAWIPVDGIYVADRCSHPDTDDVSVWGDVKFVGDNKARVVIVVGFCRHGWCHGRFGPASLHLYGNAKDYYIGKGVFDEPIIVKVYTAYGYSDYIRIDAVKPRKPRKNDKILVVFPLFDSVTYHLRHSWRESWIHEKEGVEILASTRRTTRSGLNSLTTYVMIMRNDGRIIVKTKYIETDRYREPQYYTCEINAQQLKPLTL